MSLAFVLLLGLGTAFAITLIEETSPVLFAPWIRSLGTLACAQGGSFAFLGLRSAILAGFAGAFVATLARTVVQFVQAAGDEKATLILSRRGPRRGVM